MNGSHMYLDGYLFKTFLRYINPFHRTDFFIASISFPNSNQLLISRLVNWIWLFFADCWPKIIFSSSPYSFKLLHWPEVFSLYNVWNVWYLSNPERFTKLWFPDMSEKVNSGQRLRRRPFPSSSVCFLAKCFPGKMAHPACTINNTFLTNLSTQAAHYLHKSQIHTLPRTHVYSVNYYSHELKGLRMWSFCLRLTIGE